MLQPTDKEMLQLGEDSTKILLVQSPHWCFPREQF